MDYKVHWIIDGIMNVDANSKEDAEKNSTRKACKILLKILMI